MSINSEIKRQQELIKANIYSQFSSSIEKGRKAQVGEVRTHGGVKKQKQASGEWKRIGKNRALKSDAQKEGSVASIFEKYESILNEISSKPTFKAKRVYVEQDEFVEDFEKNNIKYGQLNGQKIALRKDGEGLYYEVNEKTEHVIKDPPNYGVVEAARHIDEEGERFSEAMIKLDRATEGFYESNSRTGVSFYSSIKGSPRVRISDHPLPDKHKETYGQSDIEIDFPQNVQSHIDEWKKEFSSLVDELIASQK